MKRSLSLNDLSNSMNDRCRSSGRSEETNLRFYRAAFSPKQNISALREFLTLIARRRDLLLALTSREITDRYSGQALGAAWAIVAPLLLMSTYALAFTFIFQVRLGENSSTVSYAAFALTGLAAWLSTQEALSRAPTAVTSNSNLVKQIVFPVELLPLKVALGTLPTLFSTLSIAAIVCFFAGVLSIYTPALLICLVLIYLIFIIGILYLVSALGVYFRDLKDIISLTFSVGFFLHPIVYAPGSIPRSLAFVFNFSPLSHLIWCFQDALFYGAVTRPYSWVIISFCAVVSFLVGYRFFRAMQSNFGNTL